MDIRYPISAELSAFLSLNPGLLQNQHHIDSSLGLAGSEALGLLPNPNVSSLLATLILQQQAEERQKASLIQQLALLGAGPYGLSSLVTPSPVDTLAQLLQQRQQLQGMRMENAPLDRLEVLRSTATSIPPNAPTSSPDKLSDLAKILQAQQQQDASSIPENASTTEVKRKGRVGSFPQKLHQILHELERQDGGAAIASFLPHGRAFAIHKPRDFVKLVMPKYFRMSRFSSFQRQLNLYDFRRATEGPDKGAYYHELFVKGSPNLSTMMKRNKIKGIKNIDDGSHEDEEGEENQS